MLQKLPQGRRGDLHFPESNSWQTDQLIADLISIISSWSEGWSSLMISTCKDCLLCEGVIFLTSDTQTQRLSVTRMWNYFKTSETLWNFPVHNVVLYVTLRAYDSLYGVKLKVAIFICDIPAMLAFLLFQINAFGTVNRSFFLLMIVYQHDKVIGCATILSISDNVNLLVTRYLALQLYPALHKRCL